MHKCISDVWVTIIFLIDCYILPISGANVVLRIQWLKTLGLIVTDYASLSMKFHWIGSTIALQGISDNTVTEISPTQLKRLHDTKYVSGYFHLAMACSTDATNLDCVH